MKFEKAVLPNGLTLVVEQHPQVRSASVGVWVKVGSLNETPLLSGISHFIEHMVFKGTQKRDPLQIVTALESLGGDLNAFTDKEVTSYHATVLSEHIEVAIDVLSDMLTQSTFPKIEIERERKVLFQELSMIKENPDEWISDLFYEAISRKHPLGRAIIGNSKSLKKIGRQQLVNFFNEYYVPENMVISICGNVQFQKVKELVEKYFIFSRKERALPFKEEPFKYQKTLRAHTFNTDQLHLLMGFPSIALKNERRYQAMVLSFYLGGGMSSRLFQEIREKAGLAYTIDCEYTPYLEVGIFSIYAAIAPKNLKKALLLIGQELRKLKEEKITHSEIERIKHQIRGSILLSSDLMDVRQESIGRNELYFQKNIQVEEVIEMINQVTPSDLQKLSNEMFTLENETLLTLSKKKPKMRGLTVFI